MTYHLYAISVPHDGFAIGTDLRSHILECETYEGIDAFEAPCSGFVVHDAASGQVCAGEQQRGGSGGSLEPPGTLS